MKKVVSFILAMMLVVSLAACGESAKTEKKETPAENKTEETKTEANKTETPAEKSGEEVTLRFVGWQTNHQEVDKKAAEEYNKLHPNVKVVFDYYGDQNASEYTKKVDLMLMGGEEMDIVATAAVPEHTQRASSGAYLALDDYFKAEGVNPEDIYSCLPVVDGKVYCMPADWKAWVVLLNKSYLEEAGLPVPSLDWTWEDYEEYAKKLTKGDGAEKRFGGYFHVWDTFNYMGVVSTKMDNAMLKADGSLNYDDPNLKSWIEFRNQLENVDKCSIPLAEAKAMSVNYRSKFFNGEIAMLPIGTWMINELDDQDKYPHDFQTTFAPLPVFRDGKAGRTLVEAHFYSVSKNSKHPQEAYDFLRFYTTEGMKIRGVSISAVKGADRMEYVQKMVDDPKYCDMDALKNVLNNPAWEDNLFVTIPKYQVQLTKILTEETEKYLLGENDVDKALSEMMSRGQKVVEENK